MRETIKIYYWWSNQMATGDKPFSASFSSASYQYLLFQQLQYSQDEQLAAITAKSLKEATYHLRWSSEWVIRLGDGTAESHKRMLRGY